jgi:uncharacterized protein (DUF1684 family)
MIMGSVLFDFNRAKELNHPLCARGHKWSCVVVVASDCIVKLTENGKVPLAALDPAILNRCVLAGGN